MSVSKNLYKVLNPYFKGLGFRKYGSCFYKIENDIAFCFTPEFVSHVRVWCYILPLYMPTEFRHLTYGENIEFVHRELACLICTYDEITEEDAIAWLGKMAPVIENEVLPFFKTISSPELLLQYCDLPAYERSRYLPYGGQHLFRLQGYTSLYLGEKEIAKKAIENYRECTLSLKNHSPSYIERHVTESYEMEKMLLLPDDERARRLQEICAQTLYNCFTPKKRNTEK
ncbi:MAG: hypothetical protein IJW34_05855 [Clostridia bacterium]|nr:hypothetical protein [Clostridia bacterium]